MNLNKRITKSPKLYFTDTGLLCYLLGLEQPDQLSINGVLRGMVFENLAVTELLKKRTNSNKKADLFYFRESARTEVDVIRESPDGLHLYEIKSNKTLQTSYSHNMKTLSKSANVASMTIIYDGPDLPPTALNVRSI